MTIDLAAIEARANAALKEPCNEQHGLFEECHSCDSDVLQSLRTDIPVLIARVRELEAQIAAVVAIHGPYAVYTECHHNHDPDVDEPGVVDVPDVGRTCAKMYDTCSSCCSDAGGDQSEECISEHQHGPGVPICLTIAALRACGWKEQE